MNRIKYQNSQKLHVSKSPCIWSWILAFGLISTSILLIASKSLNNYFKGFLILSFVLIGFLILEKWEDLVFDKQTGNVIITRSNWLERFLCKVPVKNSIIFPIGDIIEVNLNKLNGVELHLRNGKSILVSKYDDNSLEKLKDLRLNISTFLHLERVENCQRHYFWDFSSDFFDFHSSNERENEIEEPTEQLSRFGCREAIKVILPPQRRQQESD